jgi:hypothetical protein
MSQTWDIKGQPLIQQQKIKDKTVENFTGILHEAKISLKEGIGWIRRIFSPLLFAFLHFDLKNQKQTFVSLCTVKTTNF